MRIDVLKGSKYIVILERDEDEMVRRVLPIKVVDFFKKEKKDEVKNEVKDFLKKSPSNFKIISFFVFNPKILSIFNECINELNQELNIQIKTQILT
jgi:hypothetical protein